MYRVKCVKHLQGEMNGYAYDNHKFFCETDAVPKSLVCGQNIEILKIKTLTFAEIAKSRGYDPAAMDCSSFRSVWEYG